MFSKLDEAEVARRFDHHPPSSPAVVRQHVQARDVVKGTAIVLAKLLPEGPEKANSIRHLETALFWANAAIARQEGN